MTWQGVIPHYRAYLPVTSETPIITLKEGNTPLIEATNLNEAIGNDLRIYLKYEGLNPTSSFKDRGMTVAISKSVEDGAQAVMCASTGNTSASAAAYAAKAKLRCIVLVPKGEIALGKLAQALMHGAKVLAVDGNFDQALQLVRDITEKHPIHLVNSLNPYRIEGQKTGAFEVIDHLGFAPDYQAIPVGNAGNITAYWKGYKEYYDCGKVESLPKMLGFQSYQAAPIVLGYPIKKPQTVASAIKIGNPASWRTAEEARGRIERINRSGIRRRNPASLSDARKIGGVVRRTRFRSVRRWRHQIEPERIFPAGFYDCLHPDRTWLEGSGHCARRDRGRANYSVCEPR